MNWLFGCLARPEVAGPDSGETYDDTHSSSLEQLEAEADLVASSASRGADGNGDARTHAQRARRAHAALRFCANVARSRSDHCVLHVPLTP